MKSEGNTRSFEIFLTLIPTEIKAKLFDMKKTITILWQYEQF